MARELVLDAGEKNRTEEGDALIAEMAAHKERQEAELAEAERLGIGLGSGHIPRREVNRSGNPGDVKTEAGALVAPVIEEETKPTYSEIELLQLRASGLRLTDEAETFLAAREESRREQDERLNKCKHEIALRAPEVAQAYRDAQEADWKAREKRLKTAAGLRDAERAYKALRGQAYEYGIEDFPYVANEAEIEARLSDPDHDRIHALRRAEGVK